MTREGPVLCQDHRHELRYLEPMLWRFIVVLVVMAVAGASCHSGSDGGGVSLDQLVDGAWELRVDRAWSTTGDRRSTALSENDYQPVPDGATFPIVVSDHGFRVTIGTAPEWNRRLRFPLEGSRSSFTEAITYNLDQGTFAGGR